MRANKWRVYLFASQKVESLLHCEMWDASYESTTLEVVSGEPKILQVVSLQSHELQFCKLTISVAELTFEFK